MRLFMYIAFADASLGYTQFFAQMACKLGLPTFFAYSLFESGDIQEKCLYAYQTINLAFVSEVFWLFMACALNTCLCLDLILMIKYPFAKKAQFMNWYLSVSTILSLLVAVRPSWVFGRSVYIKTNVILLISYAIFIVAGVVSSIFAYNFFSRPGMSREVKDLIMKRHISCIVFFFVVNQYVMISCVQNLAYPDFNAENTYWWCIILKVMFYMQGYFMPFIRCTEPAFIQNFKFQMSIVTDFLTCNRKKVDPKTDE